MNHSPSPPGARVHRGRDAEALAERHLEAAGFRLLWRNVRIGPLEIDLVMMRDDLAVIVEVRSRSRSSFQGPLASITRTKRMRLLRAARGIWRGRLARMPDVKRVRIDVVAITRDKSGAPEIAWIPGAITEQDG